MSASAWGKLCKKARNLTNSLGHRVAAGYLRNRGVEFETAYRILFNREPSL